MKTAYICNKHVENIQRCEAHAINLWQQMMRRGLRAKDDCRIDAACIYFDTAIDIVLLRYVIGKNKLFSEYHIQAPCSLLLEILLAMDEFDKAITLINKLTDVVYNEVPKPSSIVLLLINNLYKKVESAEKYFFIQKGKYQKCISQLSYSHQVLTVTPL